MSLLVLVSGCVACADAHRFPGKPEDLSLGEYWYRGAASHGGGPNDSQLEGYDLGGMRFDQTTNQFVELRLPSPANEVVDGSQNDHFMIYGQPVYAMAGGTIVRCWRNAPENPSPGPTHSRFPAEIFGGGNMLFVDHGSGKVALYAHFQPGTIPPQLCPNNDQFHPDANGKDWNSTITAGELPTVAAGDFIGCVGNSGSSGGPHLHVHLFESLDGPSTPYGAAVDLPFTSFRVKSSTLGQDLVSGWIEKTDESLPPGPIVILPASQTPRYGPAALIGRPWGDFLTNWQDLENQGYRMHDFESYELDGRRVYSGILTPGTYGPVAIIDRPWNDFLATWQQFEERGYRMHDFESYRIEGTRVYSGILKPGSYYPAAVIDQPWPDFLAAWQALESQGYRMHDFESYEHGGRRVYSGILTPDTYDPVALIGRPWDDFLASWQDFERQGYRMHDFETYILDGRRVYSGILKPGSHKPAAWIGTPWPEFLEKWSQLELLNYRLEDFEAYPEDSPLRYAGIFSGVEQQTALCP